MSLSNTYENDILDDIVGDVPTNPVGGAARYLALFTADPGEAGSLASEVSGGSYARVDTAGSWAAAAGGSKSTNALLTFPAATADWADGSPNQVTHWALCDAASGGNVVWSGAFSTGHTILNTYVFEVEAGAVTITAD